MKPWPTMDDVLRVAREFKAQLEKEMPHLAWRHEGNAQLNLLGMGCPPCNGNCRQGRDCPAKDHAKDVEQDVQGSGGDAEA